MAGVDTIGVAALAGTLVLVLALLALNDWLRVRAGVPAVRTLRGIAFAFRFIPRAWKAAPGPLLVCTAIGALEFAANLNWPDSPFVAVAFGLPLLVAQVFAYAACHRVALAGCGAPGRMTLGRFGFQAKAVERDVAISWLVTGVIFVGVLLAAAIVAGVIAVTVRLVAGETAAVVSAASLVALALGAVLYVAGRLYFAPAAFAVKGIDGLGEAWRLARGAVFAGIVAMMVGVVFLFAVLGVLVAPFLLASPELDVVRAGSSVATLVSAALLLPFSAGLISYFYLDATGAETDRL